MLEKDTKYFGRVRYKATNGAITPWSNVVEFEPSGIEPPSFLVADAITASATSIKLALTPFEAASSVQSGIRVETSLFSDFRSILSTQTFTNQTAFATFQISAVNLQNHYLRFKYLSMDGGQSVWSNTKVVMYVASNSGVNINGLVLSINPFSVLGNSTAVLTVVGSSNFNTTSVTGLVTTPNSTVSGVGFNPTSGIISQTSGSAVIPELLQGTYYASVTVKVIDSVTSEPFEFVLTSSMVYPTPVVNKPDMTGLRTTIEAAGSPSYPNGLPAHILPKTEYTYIITGTGVVDGRSMSYELRSYQENVWYVTVSKVEGYWLYNWSIVASTEYGPDPATKTFYVALFFEKLSTSEPNIWTTTIEATGAVNSFQPGQGDPAYPNGLPPYVEGQIYFDLTSSAFTANWSQTHASTEWQIALSEYFTSLFLSSTVSTGNKLFFTTGNLNKDTIYYGRVRYKSNTGTYSAWSDTLTMYPIDRTVDAPTVTFVKQATAGQGNASYPSGLPPYVAPSGNPSYPSGLPPYVAPSGNSSYPQGLPDYWRTFQRTAGTSNYSLYNTDGAVLRGNWSQSGSVYDPSVGMSLTAGIQSDPNNYFAAGFVVNLGGGSAAGAAGNPPYRANGGGWTYNSGSNTSTCAASVPLAFRSTFISNSGRSYVVTIPWGTLTQSGLPSYPSGLAAYSSGQGSSAYPSGLPPYSAGQGNSSYPSGLPPYVAPQKYFDLTSSAFNANWNQTHGTTEWQISTVNTFATLFQSATVSAGNKLILKTNNMVPATTYYGRVRYKTPEGIYSNWSSTVTLS